MFDVGFSELVVIAVVALVVIGPERLPTVARTVGALLGRLNRYVADVKSDVEREMRLEEMKKLRAEVEQQAMSIEQSVVKEMETTRQAVEQPLAETHQSLAEVMHQTGQAGLEMQPAVGNGSSPAPTVVPGLQKNQADATLTAPPSASDAKDSAPSAAQPETPQHALDFDAFNDPAPQASSSRHPSTPKA